MFLNLSSLKKWWRNTFLEKKVSVSSIPIHVQIIFKEIISDNTINGVVNCPNVRVLFLGHIFHHTFSKLTAAPLWQWLYLPKASLSTFISSRTSNINILAHLKLKKHPSVRHHCECCAVQLGPVTWLFCCIRHERDPGLLREEFSS